MGSRRLVCLWWVDAHREGGLCAMRWWGAHNPGGGGEGDVR